MIDYRLYLVTDEPSRYAENWLDKIVAAVEGGVTCVQYRDTENSSREQYGRILRLKDALKGRVPLIVNNDAELAKAVKADGVHVGQNDMPPERVRFIVGAGVEIGLSITSIAQLQGVPPVVDALGVGPVFDATKTKADASAAMGVAALKAIMDEATLPAVAIGGINLENAAEVLSSGATGLAIVSAFSKSENPYETAIAFSRLFDNRRQ